MFQMAGRAKENLPGGSLKYLFVYLKNRIFKCSYRIYKYPTAVQDLHYQIWPCLAFACTIQAQEGLQMFDKPDLIYPYGGFLKWGIPKWF